MGECSAKQILSEACNSGFKCLTGESVGQIMLQLLCNLNEDGIKFKDSAFNDAFSRIRVSNPTSLFDSQFRYNLQPLIFGTATANGGAVAHSANNSSALLSLDGTANGSAILQSKDYHRYIPGKSQLILMTGALGEPVGNTKRLGYFDSNNGTFFQQSPDGTVAFVRRTSTSGSPVDNVVPQSSWNVDKMDGTGPSKITLDSAKSQVLVIDVQWLGMGRIRCGFSINGHLYIAHEFLIANILSTVSMRTSNLPVRWEISGDEADGMLATCSSVQSEGGALNAFAYQFAYNRAPITANATPTYAFSIRPKQTFNGITNRIKIDPTAWQCYVSGNNAVRVDIYYGTTAGGTPAWTDMNATYSALQVDTAGTPSGGILVNSFWVPVSATVKEAVTQQSLSRYPLTLDIAGTGFNHYSVFVTSITTTSVCHPSMIWEEDR